MNIIQSLIAMRSGILWALLTIIFGYCLGGAFGGASGDLKGYLKQKAFSVLDTTYSGDAKKTEKVLDKSWTYLKRSHLHASGLGTTAIALMMLLAVCSLGPRELFWTGLSLGLGAFGYSLYWMIAGFIAPVVGSSEAAKESLWFLAIPSAGLCLIGVFATTFLFIKSFFFRKQQI